MERRVKNPSQGLTFKTAALDHGARQGVAAQFYAPDGTVRYNAVRVGKGGQAKARADLRDWAKAAGWNG